MCWGEVVKTIQMFHICLEAVVLGADRLREVIHFGTGGAINQVPVSSYRRAESVLLPIP